MQLDDPVEAKCGDYLQCEDVPAMMAAYACFHRETLALGKGGEFWVYDPSLGRCSVVRRCDSLRLHSSTVVVRIRCATVPL